MITKEGNRFAEPSEAAVYAFTHSADPNIALPLKTDDGWLKADSVDQMLDILQNVGELSPDNASILESPGFTVWLEGKDSKLARKVHELKEKSNDNKESLFYHSNSGYRIAYELNPEMDLRFNRDKEDPDRIFDIRQIGRWLNVRLSDMRLGKEDKDAFISLFCNMDDNALGHYMRARGENFMTFLSWNRYCMDVNNEENSKKPGPYDVVIGAYRSVAGFMGESPLFPLGDRLISSPSMLSEFPENVVAAAIDGRHRTMPGGTGKPVPWLDAWLTVFYQENPQLKMSEDNAYVNETAEYTELIAHYAPQNYYAGRYMELIDDFDQLKSRMEENDRKFDKRRKFFIILCGVLTLIMVLGSLILGLPASNPFKDHILELLIICVAGTVVYRAILWGIMDTLSSIWTYIFGAAVGAVMYGCYEVSAKTFGLTGLGYLALVTAYFVYHLYDRSNADASLRFAGLNNFKNRNLEALYFAYKDTNRTLDNDFTKYAENQLNWDKSSLESLMTDGWRWVAQLVTFLVVWFFITPQISGNLSWAGTQSSNSSDAGIWAVGRWEGVLDSGKDVIVCEIDSVCNGREIYGTMKVGSHKPAKAKGIVKSKNDSIPESFSFEISDKGKAESSVSAEYDADEQIMTGYYNGDDGSLKRITFTSTPLKVKQ